MNGDDVYKSLAVGQIGSLTYQGRTGDSARWNRFAEKVCRLDQMEADGLIKITKRHREQQSGFQHVDMVLFVRLR